MRKKTDINEVAKLAGVSISTVSRTMNNPENVRKKTRIKIEKAIEALNYEPNSIAKGLRSSESRIIGVMIPDIVNPFFAAILKGIEVELKNSGYYMFLASSDYQEEEEIRYAKEFINIRVDGVLMSPSSIESKAIKILKDTEIPFFILNAIPKDKNINWASNNSIEGTLIATRYLIENGHRKITFLECTKFKEKNRFEGFKKGIKECHLKLKNQIILDCGNTKDDGYNIIKKHIEKFQGNESTTAIISVNDIVAIGVIEALLESGIKVPDDISVIGYDNINISSMLKIPLTTIDQPKHELGEIVAINLIEKIKRKEKELARNFLFNPKLIVRESTRKIDI